jgi:hypothetical protein
MTSIARHYLLKCLYQTMPWEYVVMYTCLLDYRFWLGVYGVPIVLWNCSHGIKQSINQSRYGIFVCLLFYDLALFMFNKT